MQSYGIAVYGAHDGDLKLGAPYILQTRYLVPGDTLYDGNPKGLFAERLVPVSLRKMPAEMRHLHFYAYDPTTRAIVPCESGSAAKAPGALASALDSATHVLRVDEGPAAFEEDRGMASWRHSNAAKVYPNRQVLAFAISGGKLYRAIVVARSLPRPGQPPLRLSMRPTSLEWLPDGSVRRRYADLMRIDRGEATIREKQAARSSCELNVVVRSRSRRYDKAVSVRASPIEDMAPDGAPYRKVWVTAIWRLNTEGELVASAHLTGLDETRYSVRVIPGDGATAKASPREVDISLDDVAQMEFVVRE